MHIIHRKYSGILITHKHTTCILPLNSICVIGLYGWKVGVLGNK